MIILLRWHKNDSKKTTNNISKNNYDNEINKIIKELYNLLLNEKNGKMIIFVI